MALYSKRQFAELAQVPTNNLSNYIKRGHVILHGRDACRCPKNKCTCLIDSGDPKNQLFLQRQGITETATPVPQKQASKAPPKTEASPRPTHAKTRLIELQEAKLEKQNQELENRNRLLEAKIQKTYEEVIPREFAGFMIKNYALSIKDVWLTATERFLMQKGTAFGLTREEIIEHKKYITEILNEAIRKGAEEANANIRRIARQFAGKKDRGEHDD